MYHFQARVVILLFTSTSMTAVLAARLGSDYDTYIRARDAKLALLFEDVWDKATRAPMVDWSVNQQRIFGTESGFWGRQGPDQRETTLKWKANVTDQVHALIEKLRGVEHAHKAASEKEILRCLQRLFQDKIENDERFSVSTKRAKPERAEEKTRLLIILWFVFKTPL
jgi:hypothetical protein